MNNRQAALIAAAAGGTDALNLERQTRIYELWLNELDSAEDAKELTRSLDWITRATEAILSLEQSHGEPVVDLDEVRGDPVVRLAGGDRYRFADDRWFAIGSAN